MMVKVVKVGNATFPIGNYITPGGMCISLYESYYFYLHSFIYADYQPLSHTPYLHADGITARQGRDYGSSGASRNLVFLYKR